MASLSQHGVGASTGVVAAEHSRKGVLFMRIMRAACGVVCATGVLALGAGQALGQVYEPFDYPGGGSLIGANGGRGWLGPWQSAGYGNLVAGDKSSPLIYKRLRVMDSGGRAEGVEGSVQRSLASSFGAAGTTMWGRCSMQQTGGPSASSWLGVKLPSTDPGSDPFLWIGKPLNQANLGVEKGTAGSVRTVGGSPATSFARILWRVDFHAGADDVYIWLDAPLDAEPDLASADLALPAYGNFEGISKVLLEMGSTGEDTHGWIDELRLGSTFAEVTPLADELYVGGRACQPLPDSILAPAADPTINPGIRVMPANPGTALPYGAEVVMETTGGGVHFGPGDLASIGGGIRIRHKGWDGVIYGTHLSTATPEGGFVQELAYPGAAAIRHQVFDGNGNPIGDDTTPGEIRIVNTGAVSGPCPGGGFPQWWFTTVYYNPPKFVNGQYIEFEHVWVYGCHENAPILRTISTPLFDSPPATPRGLGSLEIQARRPAFFDIFFDYAVSPVDEQKNRGFVIVGTGEAIAVAEDCDDGSDSCMDWSVRRLPVRNLGSSGQDGVDIKPYRRAISHFDFFADVNSEGDFELRAPELHNSFGAMRVSHTGEGPDLVPIELVSLDLRGLGDGEGVIARPDFSRVGSPRYVIEMYMEGRLVGRAERDNGDGLVLKQLCPPPLIPIWGWEGNAWRIIDCTTRLIDDPTIGTLDFDMAIIRPVNDTPVPIVRTMLRGWNLPNGFEVGAITYVGPCDADFNGDGFTDFFDFDAFVACFEGSSCPPGRNADQNDDGFVDFFDLDEFVADFESGC